MPRPTAMIIGVAGLEISEQERQLIEQLQPFGLILFKRNCHRARQVRDLVADFKSLVAHDAPILIDQEGGRVNRLTAPPWPPFPAPGALTLLEDADIGRYDDAIYWHARLTGEVLRNLDITVNCSPVLDVPTPDSDPIVLGDRTLGDNATAVESAGLHAIRGLREAGIVPVIKHLPGHGRATVDSHHALPVIDCDLETLEKTDFRPFAAASLFYGDRLLGMTGHLLLPALDDKPVTLSSTIINEVIRDKIGFSGHLMADDIQMGALSQGGNENLADRASMAIMAGCDSVLYCAPDTSLWGEIAEAVGEIGDHGWQSWQAAESSRSTPATPMDHETFLTHHRRWLTPAMVALSNHKT
ncbi:MAG: glycoside hydrolase family 3 N-terminal domain-containing protein, partial [Pseudomonadota bacterium]